MMRTILPWWQARTPREQLMVAAAGALLLLVLAWLLIIRPLGNALSDAQSRHGEATMTLAEVRAQADLLRARKRQPSIGPEASVDSIVSESATAAGFTIARLDRESSRQARIVIDAVRPQAFFAWVGEMETGRNLAVERLSATTNSDQTLAVQVSFRAKGE